ncbi:MAG: hypothetical protein F9K36_08375, partial [Burkholderiaceae bacterium]
MTTTTTIHRATSALAKLFGPWVREVDRGTLRADALAGLLGAVLVLPQAIAFAALLGLPPSYGLATAVRGQELLGVLALVLLVLEWLTRRHLHPLQLAGWPRP